MFGINLKRVPGGRQTKTWFHHAFQRNGCGSQQHARYPIGERKKTHISGKYNFQRITWLSVCAYTPLLCCELFAARIDECIVGACVASPTQIANVFELNRNDLLSLAVNARAVEQSGEMTACRRTRRKSISSVYLPRSHRRFENVPHANTSIVFYYVRNCGAASAHIHTQM